MRHSIFGRRAGGGRVTRSPQPILRHANRSEISAINPISKQTECRELRSTGMSMYREYRGRHSFQGGDGGVENAAGAVNERFSAASRENFTNPKKNPSYTAAKMLRARGLQTYLLLYGPTKPNLQLIRLLTSDEVLKYVFLELLRLCKEIIAD